MRTVDVGSSLAPIESVDRAIEVLIRLRDEAVEGPVRASAPWIAARLPSLAQLRHVELLGPPFAQVVSAGQAVPDHHYCTLVRANNTSDPAPVLDWDRVAMLLNGGDHGGKFNRMEVWTAGVRSIANALASQTGRRVKAWGFASTTRDTLFAEHRDPAEVIAIQVTGSKRWQLGTPAPVTAWTGGDTIEGDPSESLILRPGDLLALPYGFSHSAIAVDSVSFHITFAFEGMTVGEYHHQLLQGLIDVVGVRDARLLTSLDDERRTVHDVVVGYFDRR